MSEYRRQTSWAFQIQLRTSPTQGLGGLLGCNVPLSHCHYPWLCFTIIDREAQWKCTGTSRFVTWKYSGEVPYQCFASGYLICLVVVAAFLPASFFETNVTDREKTFIENSDGKKCGSISGLISFEITVINYFCIYASWRSQFVVLFTTKFVNHTGHIQITVRKKTKNKTTNGKTGFLTSSHRNSQSTNQ